MIDTNLFIKNIEKNREITWKDLHLKFGCPEWNYDDADTMFDICSKYGIEPEYNHNNIGYLCNPDYGEYITLCKKYIFGSAMINNDTMNNMIAKYVEKGQNIEWAYMYIMAGSPHFTTIDYVKMMKICNAHGIEPRIYEGENRKFTFIGYLLKK